MASVFYNQAKANLANGTIAFLSDTIKVALLMTNTTADTQNSGVTYVGDITTLDECDATGYSRKTLGSKAINVDNGNNRAEFDGADASFTGLSGNATRSIQGALIYKHVTNDADSPVICFIDFASDVAGTATQIDVPWDAEGIFQLT